MVPLSAERPTPTDPPIPSRCVSAWSPEALPSPLCQLPSWRVLPLSHSGPRPPRPGSPGPPPPPPALTSPLPPPLEGLPLQHQVPGFPPRPSCVSLCPWSPSPSLLHCSLRAGEPGDEAGPESQSPDPPPRGFLGPCPRSACCTHSGAWHITCCWTDVLLAERGGWGPPTHQPSPAALPADELFSSFPPRVLPFPEQGFLGHPEAWFKAE